MNESSANRPKLESKAELRQRAEKEHASRTRGGKELAPDEKDNLLHELEVHQIELEMQNEELLQIRHELQESHDRYLNLFDFAPIGYFVLNKHFKILQTNLKGALMLGLERGSLTGEGLTRYVAPECQDDIYRFFRSAGSNETDREVEMLRRDGTRFYALLNVRQESDSKGDTTYRVAVTDITERKKSEQIKDEFIGMVSHELKTPLTVVIGAINTAISEGINGEEARELLKDAAWGAHAMVDIVDNLLELSRWQANRLVLSTGAVDVGVVIRKMVEQLSGHSAVHRLVMDISPGLPAVKADSTRLERILDNLISNAIKYSPNGGEVRVSAQRDGNHLVIGVHDHGVGIAAADQERLFQPFQRIEQGIGTSVQGVGLGLVVCRRLVETHGGRVWFESEPGKGSTFYFTLPLSSSGQV